MKFFSIGLLLFLVFGNLQGSTLPQKRSVRALNTTLQSHFNGSYERRDPCSNAEVERSSYSVSHKFQQHSKEDNWCDYTKKCSEIIGNFFRAITSLLTFNGNRQGTYNFQIDTTISHEKDGDAGSTPRYVIKAGDCECPGQQQRPSCEASQSTEPQASPLTESVQNDFQRDSPFAKLSQAVYDTLTTLAPPTGDNAFPDYAYEPPQARRFESQSEVYEPVQTPLNSKLPFNDFTPEQVSSGYAEETGPDSVPNPEIMSPRQQIPPQFQSPVIYSDSTPTGDPIPRPEALIFDNNQIDNPRGQQEQPQNGFRTPSFSLEGMIPAASPETTGTTQEIPSTDDHDRPPITSAQFSTTISPEQQKLVDFPLPDTNFQSEALPVYQKPRLPPTSELSTPDDANPDSFNPSQSNNLREVKNLEVSMNYLPESQGLTAESIPQTQQPIEFSGNHPNSNSPGRKLEPVVLNQNMSNNFSTGQASAVGFPEFPSVSPEEKLEQDQTPVFIPQTPKNFSNSPQQELQATSTETQPPEQSAQQTFPQIQERIPSDQFSPPMQPPPFFNGVRQPFTQQQQPETFGQQPQNPSYSFDQVSSQRLSPGSLVAPNQETQQQPLIDDTFSPLSSSEQSSSVDSASSTSTQTPPQQPSSNDFAFPSREQSSQLPPYFSKQAPSQEPQQPMTMDNPSNQEPEDLSSSGQPPTTFAPDSPFEQPPSAETFSVESSNQQPQQPSYNFQQGTSQESQPDISAAPYQGPQQPLMNPQPESFSPFVSQPQVNTFDRPTETTPTSGPQPESFGQFPTTFAPLTPPEQAASQGLFQPQFNNFNQQRPSMMEAPTTQGPKPFDQAPTTFAPETPAEFEPSTPIQTPPQQPPSYEPSNDYLSSSAPEHMALTGRPIFQQPFLSDAPYIDASLTPQNRLDGAEVSSTDNLPQATDSKPDSEFQPARSLSDAFLGQQPEPTFSGTTSTIPPPSSVDSYQDVNDFPFTLAPESLTSEPSPNAGIPEYSSSLVAPQPTPNTPTEQHQSPPTLTSESQLSETASETQSYPASQFAPGDRPTTPDFLRPSPELVPVTGQPSTFEHLSDPSVISQGPAPGSGLPEYPLGRLVDEPQITSPRPPIFNKNPSSPFEPQSQLPQQSGSTTFPPDAVAQQMEGSVSPNYQTTSAPGPESNLYAPFSQDSTTPYGSLPTTIAPMNIPQVQSEETNPNPTPSTPVSESQPADQPTNNLGQFYNGGAPMEPQQILPPPSFDYNDERFQPSPAPPQESNPDQLPSVSTTPPLEETTYEPQADTNTRNVSVTWDQVVVSEETTQKPKDPLYYVPVSTNREENPSGDSGSQMPVQQNVGSYQQPSFDQTNSPQEPSSGSMGDSFQQQNYNQNPSNPQGFSSNGENSTTVPPFLAYGDQRPSFPSGTIYPQTLGPSYFGPQGLESLTTAPPQQNVADSQSIDYSQGFSKNINPLTGAPIRFEATSPRSPTQPQNTRDQEAVSFPIQASPFSEQSTTNEQQSLTTTDIPTQPEIPLIYPIQSEAPVTDNNQKENLQEPIQNGVRTSSSQISSLETMIPVSADDQRFQTTFAPPAQSSEPPSFETTTVSPEQQEIPQQNPAFGLSDTASIPSSKEGSSQSQGLPVYQNSRLPTPESLTVDGPLNNNRNFVRNPAQFWPNPVNYPGSIAGQSEPQAQQPLEYSGRLPNFESRTAPNGQFSAMAPQGPQSEFGNDGYPQGTVSPPMAGFLRQQSDNLNTDFSNPRFPGEVKSTFSPQDQRENLENQQIAPNTFGPLPSNNFPGQNFDRNVDQGFSNGPINNFQLNQQQQQPFPTSMESQPLPIQTPLTGGPRSDNFSGFSTASSPQPEFQSVPTEVQSSEQSAQQNLPQVQEQTSSDQVSQSMQPYSSPPFLNGVQQPFTQQPQPEAFSQQPPNPYFSGQIPPQGPSSDSLVATNQGPQQPLMTDARMPQFEPFNRFGTQPQENTFDRQPDFRPQPESSGRLPTGFAPLTAPEQTPQVPPYNPEQASQEFPQPSINNFNQQGPSTMGRQPELKPFRAFGQLPTTFSPLTSSEQSSSVESESSTSTQTPPPQPSSTDYAYPSREQSSQLPPYFSRQTPSQEPQQPSTVDNPTNQPELNTFDQKIPNDASSMQFESSADQSSVATKSPLEQSFGNSDQFPDRNMREELSTMGPVPSDNQQGPIPNQLPTARFQPTLTPEQRQQPVQPYPFPVQSGNAQPDSFQPGFTPFGQKPDGYQPPQFEAVEGTNTQDLASDSRSPDQMFLPVAQVQESSSQQPQRNSFGNYDQEGQMRPTAPNSNFNSPAEQVSLPTESQSLNFPNRPFPNQQAEPRYPSPFPVVPFGPQFPNYSPDNQGKVPVQTSSVFFVRKAPPNQQADAKSAPFIAVAHVVSPMDPGNYGNDQTSSNPVTTPPSQSGSYDESSSFPSEPIIPAESFATSDIPPNSSGSQSEPNFVSQPNPGVSVDQDVTTQPPESFPLVPDITTPSSGPGENPVSCCTSLLCPFNPNLKGNMTAPSYYILISKLPTDSDEDRFQIEKVYLGDGTPLNCASYEGTAFPTSRYREVPFTSAGTVKLRTKPDNP